jgi:prophage antirepressor-like protein
MWRRFGSLWRQRNDFTQQRCAGKVLPLYFENRSRMANTQNEIILYQPDNTVEVEVRLENENVWLTQAQIAMLFGTKRPAITKHLNNIYNTGELEEHSTCSILEHMGNDSKQTYQTKFYNLDAILSVGYRVNSRNATLFRRWATQVLKEYILKGYVINERFERLEYRMTETEKKIDFFVKTALPPVQGIFFDGQIFDAYKFVSDLVERAKQRVVVIDNYLDTSVFTLLTKRGKGVSATIYTGDISSTLQLDLSRHNAQYPKITIEKKTNIHDRFLIIDNDLYHIGASLKDLGKKLFAFAKMEVSGIELLKHL